MSKSSKALAETDLKNLLAKAGGTYVTTYEGLVAQVNKEAVERQPRSTVETRKAAWDAAIRALDRTVLAKMNKKLTGLMRLAKANAEITNAAEPTILDQAEAFSLMTEYIDLKSIQEFAVVRQTAIKRRVFGSMTESKAAAGVEYPEHVNADLEVPALGQKFCREGMGRVDPQLDENKLKELVGDEIWNQVVVTEVIPAYTVTSFDLDEYMLQARKNPELLVKLKDALVVPEGDKAWKNGRLVLRDIKKES